MALLSHPLQRAKSLHEQAYQALRTSILSGELAPGDRLVETQLAKKLDVSRTPLREALRKLQQEGLATADASGGLRVTTISAAEAIELYDCRLALETFAVQEACKQSQTDDIEQLAYYVTEAEKLTQHPEPSINPAQLLELDYRFHRLIAESSRNRYLVALLEQIFDAMALMRMQTLCHNPQVLDIRLEHRQIFEAIAQRESLRAVEAITTHLTASKRRVVAEIESLQLPLP